ncbi:YsnF/AvaK domain-containing protein [uncultured Jannaschia sp.]|uniref:YsnF/AvaK domain-containing protein n=1 Tax=uncultured Jannaschia sp. TaxID=293347 RepID=UPI002604C412|nr:YsnF/AvaK domain-containing protein [uncultured Jannaschia sp.]
MNDVQTITAFFDDRHAADTAASRIEDAGIPRSNISLVEGTDPSASGHADGSGEEGFMASLKELFAGPDDDHDTYAEGLRRGGYLLSVSVSGAQQDKVVEILDRDGTVDLDARSESWRAEGWAGGPATSTAGSTSSADDGTIDVVEEEMRVGKRSVTGGRVRVRSHTVSEDVSEDVTLRSEHIDIDRRPVDRELSADAANAVFEDRTIEVEESSEEAVVEKTAHVVEEIGIDKTVEDHTETVSDTVRHTEVEIDDARRDGAVRKPTGA